MIHCVAMLFERVVISSSTFLFSIVRRDYIRHLVSCTIIGVVKCIHQSHKKGKASFIPTRAKTSGNKSVIAPQGGMLQYIGPPPRALVGVL